MAGAPLSESHVMALNTYTLTHTNTLPTAREEINNNTKGKNEALVKTFPSDKQEIQLSIRTML